MAPRALASVLLLLALAALAALRLAPGPAPEPLARRVDGAIARGAAWLVAAQEEDGAFRRSVYGSLRDGPSLTPIALKTLAYLPGVPGAEAAARRAAAYMAGLVRPDGTIDAGSFGLVYPVYSSGLTVIGLAKLGDPAHERAREAWLAYLIGQQYTVRLGYGPEDPGYGGWGYGLAAPRPAPGAGGPPGAPANLSATLFAVGAIRAAGRPDKDPALRAAARFLESVQNEDGGFFASPIDEVLNKAGPAPGGGYRSYGSATADGLRALLACGADPRTGRAAAARSWLLSRFLPDRHAGDFVPERAALRDAYFLYYAWSAAHALLRSGAGGAWAGALAGELCRRQRPDGTWRNPLTDGREDDPLVATCLSLGALANCRAALGE